MVSARDVAAEWLTDDELLEEVGGRQMMAKPQIRQRSGAEKFASACRHRRRKGTWSAGGMHRRSGYLKK